MKENISEYKFNMFRIIMLQGKRVSVMFSRLPLALFISPSQLKAQLLPGMPVLKQSQGLEYHGQEEGEQGHGHVHRIATQPVVVFGQILRAVDTGITRRKIQQNMNELYHEYFKFKYSLDP